MVNYVEKVVKDILWTLKMVGSKNRQIAGVILMKKQ